MKKQIVRIEYNCKNIDLGLEDDIHKTMKKHKFNFVGSGYALDSHTRDLEFVRK